MVLVLRHDDVRASVNMADAIEAMETGFREEGEGGVQQPQRTNITIGEPKAVSQARTVHHGAFTVDGIQSDEPG